MNHRESAIQREPALPFAFDPPPIETPARELIVVGIDPGKSGGLVAISGRGRCLAAHRAETYTVPKDYDDFRMAEILREIRPDLVILERQHAMPDFASKRKEDGSEDSPRKQGATSTFKTGEGYGLWRGVLAGCGFRYERVTSQSWQAVILRGVPGEGKQRAVNVVRHRIPDLRLIPERGSKPHTGLADAGCLALYGLTRLGMEAR